MKSIGLPISFVGYQARRGWVTTGLRSVALPTAKAQPQQAGLRGTSAVGDQQAALRRGACAQPPTIELTPHTPWGAGREPGAGAGCVAWTNRTPVSAAE